MFWGRIHRMILIDLAKIFSLALVALTGLILMAGIISELMKNGLSPSQVLVAIPLLLPSMLPYTVPATTLFAACIVYGRLSADNEILALKAAGVHILHVIWPALFLGAFASALTMFLYVDVIPATHNLLRTELGSDVEEMLYTMLRRDGCIRHPKLNYEIHMKNLHGRMLQDVIFKRYAPGGKGFDLIACAKEAELRVDLAQSQLLIEMQQCEIVEGNMVGAVESRTWPVDLPSDLTGNTAKLRATDMTWAELFDYEESTLDEKRMLNRDIDSHQLQIDIGRAAPHFAEHIQHSIRKRQICDSQILAIRSERHMRPAFALGCLCFALVGCPVGIWFSKSDYLSAFIVCFLPIITIYYPLMFCMINMARTGKLDASQGTYIADAVTLLAGIVLFWRLARN